MSSKARVSITHILSITAAFACILYYFYPFRPTAVTHVASYLRDRAGVPHTWTKYTPPSKLFSATLPSVPQYSSKTIPLPEAKNSTLTYEMYMSHDQSSSSYLIYTIQYSDDFDISEPTILLENIVQQMTMKPQQREHVKDAIYEHKNVQKSIFLHCPAIDYTTQLAGSDIAIKAFLYKKTVFVLAVFSPEKKEAKDDSARFIDSFVIHHVYEKQPA